MDNNSRFVAHFFSDKSGNKPDEDRESLPADVLERLGIHHTLTCIKGVGAGAHNGHSEASRHLEYLSGEARAIGSVIESVSEIIANTSLLAMNAKIEASNAGESGRGFSVVAGEVGRVAKQTDEALKAITTSLSNISSGLELAKKSLDDTDNQLVELVKLCDTSIEKVLDPKS